MPVNLEVQSYQLIVHVVVNSEPFCKDELFQTSDKRRKKDLLKVFPLALL